ncbi:MAG: phospholipid carrier-dependent glycosyltransferase, partial [Candidatus Dormibacteraeota bacterium]|nr:phospholipid carrier-dependent glycosyltransferase [Candidatus Dormibacteraeota bacterium]
MSRGRAALLTSPSQLPGAARALRLGSRVGAWRATEVVLVVALVGGACFLRLWQLGHVGFRGDEAVYGGQAALLAGVHPMSRHFILLSRGNSNFLLYQHLVAAVYHAVGVNDLAARAVAATFSVLTVVVTLLIARTLYDRPTAYLSAILMAASSYAVSLGRLAFLDSTLTFFFALSMLCLVRWLRTGRVLWMAAFGAAASFAIQAKLVGILVFPICVAYVLLSKSLNKLDWRRLALGGVIFLICMLPALLQLSQSLQQFLDLLPQSSRRVSYVPWYYYAKLLVGYEGPVMPALWAAGIVLGLVRRAREDMLPLLWIVVVLGFFQLYPLKAFNYMMPLVPAVSLMAARALVWLARRHVWSTALAGAAVVTMAAFAAPSLQAVLANDSFGGLKEAAEWLGQNSPDHAGVMTMSGGSAQYVFAYYANRDSYPYGRFQLATVLPGGAVVPPTPTQNATPRDWVTYWPPKLIESGTVSYLVYYTNDPRAVDGIDEPSSDAPIDMTARQRMFKRLIERYDGQLVHTVYRDHAARVWIYRVTKPLPRPEVTYTVTGGVVTLQGWGFSPNSQVTVTYAGKPVAQTVSDAHNAATASFPLPPWTRPSYRVTVSDADGSFTSFTGLPRPKVDMKVERGLVVVTGSGMPANTPVTVTYHKKPVGHTTVDSNGSMSVSFPLPPWSRPRFHLVVAGQGGTYASFNEIPRPEVTYSLRGGIITVHGSNVAPGTVLSISYGGVVLGGGQANPDGTFTAAVIPRQVRPRLRLVVTGDQGVYGNFSHVQ